MAMLESTLLSCLAASLVAMLEVCWEVSLAGLEVATLGSCSAC